MTQAHSCGRNWQQDAGLDGERSNEQRPPQRGRSAGRHERHIKECRRAEVGSLTDCRHQGTQQTATKMKRCIKYSCNINRPETKLTHHFNRIRRKHSRGALLLISNNISPFRLKTDVLEDRVYAPPSDSAAGAGFSVRPGTSAALTTKNRPRGQLERYESESHQQQHIAAPEAGECSTYDRSPHRSHGASEEVSAAAAEHTQHTRSRLESAGKSRAKQTTSPLLRDRNEVEIVRDIIRITLECKRFMQPCDGMPVRLPESLVHAEMYARIIFTSVRVVRTVQYSCVPRFAFQGLASQYNTHHVNCTSVHLSGGPNRTWRSRSQKALYTMLAQGKRVPREKTSST
ncbi:unnamed protein product [Rangifer tarandus platyrhynchus]|uniref:Uncharacterized protein n=1 Tax=Rangifer tarandus platyrhynchus TaxID=3082113 RepID=A0ABN8XM59_RANTA|nr:unnamed protein product [Rangifer tarandus platyrhynchus]